MHRTLFNNKNYVFIVKNAVVVNRKATLFYTHRTLLLNILFNWNLSMSYYIHIYQLYHFLQVDD